MDIQSNLIPNYHLTIQQMSVYSRQKKIFILKKFSTNSVFIAFLNFNWTINLLPHTHIHAHNTNKPCMLKHTPVQICLTLHRYIHTLLHRYAYLYMETYIPKPIYEHIYLSPYMDIYIYSYGQLITIYIHIHLTWYTNTLNVHSVIQLINLKEN